MELKVLEESFIEMIDYNLFVNDTVYYACEANLLINKDFENMLYNNTHQL